MSRNAYMHEVDLGPPMSPEEILAVVAEHRHHALIKPVLQLLRNHAAEQDRAGRQPAPSAPADYRAYHDGGADSTEEVFWAICVATQAS